MDSPPEQGDSIDDDTISRVVVRGRANVSAIVVCGLSADVQVHVRDGLDAASRVRAVIRAPGNNTVPVVFPRGVYFDQGIFVEVFAGAGAWSVAFKPLPD